MTNRRRDPISFATIAVIVFIASQFLLYSSFSSGLRWDLSLGWLQLHQHGYHWSVGQFNFGFFMADVISSIAFTWVLSKALRRWIA
jgi:hypothetical protein